MNTDQIIKAVEKRFTQKRDIIEKGSWDLIYVLDTVNYFSKPQIRLLLFRAIEDKEVSFIKDHIKECDDYVVVGEAYATGDMNIIDLFNDIITDSYISSVKTGAGRSGNIDLMAKLIKDNPECWDSVAYGLIERGDLLAVDLIDKTAKAEITKELMKRSGCVPDDHIDGDLIVSMMELAMESKQFKPFLILNSYVDVEMENFVEAIATSGDLDWLKRLKVESSSLASAAILSAINSGRTDIVKYMIDNSVKYNKDQMVRTAENSGYDDIMALFK